MSEVQRRNLTEQSEFIAFKVLDDEYCVDIMAVREIRGWTKSTALPHTPAYVCGLINLRGTVLPIIDLAARFGLPETEPSSRHVIIVVQVRDQLVGLLVDAVSDILTIDDEELHDTPPAAEVDGVGVKKVIAVEGRMIRLIEVDAVLPEEVQAA